MKTLDLFAGIGGWHVGLPPEFEIVAAVEQEPWKRMLHRTIYPDVPVFKDIRKVTGDAVSRSCGPIDAIVGSPPCTDASSANSRGLGVDGPETGLFREAVRLVRELRPRWVCLENSANLRSRGSDRVLGWLGEAGYTCWPFVVGAADLGAPHERKRVWIVAYATDARQKHGELARASIGRESAPHASSQRRQTQGGRGRKDDLGGRDDQATNGSDPNGRGQLECAFDGEMAWLVEHLWAGGLVRRLRVADGLSAGVSPARLGDCRSAYGDAVVPQVVNVIGQAILAADRA